MTEVIQFPPPDQPPPLLVGPFEYWHVVVNGRRVPLLTGRQAEDGGITFTVDHRFMGGPFHGEVARQVAYLLAQAIAVASGYSNLEAETKDRPFAPAMMELGK